MTLRNYFYIKRCLGENGKPLDIYKIRTMDSNADTRLDEIVNGDLDSFGKLFQDPRVTPIGRFLRRYWIDELPQLYNLGKGDIKIVGIRPMDKTTWQKYPSELMERALRQKPGLMAIDYAFARSENFDDKLEHMDEYLDKWKENPFRTDREYLTKIARNIIFKGVRSS